MTDSLSMTDSPGRLRGLLPFYRTGEEVIVERLPEGTRRVVARRANGDEADATVRQGARFGGLLGGTYSVEALGADGGVLAEELTTVGSHPGERPVHGFATSFDDESIAGTLRWLAALRCTVVQIYDWMASYSAPLGPTSGWKDPSERDVSYDALRSLAAGIRAGGGVAHAYAPVYAVDPPFAAEHPELLMYRGDGRPEKLFENIFLADPANRAWQRHFVATYGAAADSIGFNGFHLDTYGFPRAARNSQGEQLEMRSAYETFLGFVRAGRPPDQLSFNQVNGVPSAISLPDGPGFRYCEIWPPNDLWRHFEGLFDRSSGTAGRLGQPSGSPVMRGTIACYPPVWDKGAPREDCLRTVVLTGAVATCLGAGALLYGDVYGALCDPYYPKHERLAPAEVAAALEWHRFGLRCRDLFLSGEDTSWYEIGDENGAVAVGWGGPVSPEPVGGAVFARVVRDAGYIAVSVVDLSGSPNGSWQEATPPGRCRSALVKVLLDDPGGWDAAAAVLGQGRGRFARVASRTIEHREGLALEVALPVVSGWSVLRLTRRDGRTAI